MDTQSFQLIYRTSLTVFAATLCLGTAAVIHLLRFDKNDFPPRAPEHAAAVKKAVWPAVAAGMFAFDAAVFEKSVAMPDAGRASSTAGRFRLAGTFFAFGANQQSRKAILDDLHKKEQLLVTEGDLIDNDTRVQSILSDRIILRRNSGDEEIRLCFAGHGAQTMSTGIRQGADLQSRFGKMVGDKRWVLTRSELMNYYNEVLNDTDRLAKIYDSLKPVYEGRNIAGYTLVVEGEGDMFAAFGLQPGDVIRQVNSMPMTSQARAEYFISEFVKNRVNGFVLNIERAGQKEKLIYMVR
ncbi:MAG: hypothetical protein PHP98_03860 [Kiritimatiellae bacterium]|nr:hypothetical protein [Kiritimatiellia bacterium]